MRIIIPKQAQAAIIVYKKKTKQNTKKKTTQKTPNQNKSKRVHILTEKYLSHMEPQLTLLLR